MKKALLLVASLMVGCSPSFAASPYFEAIGGWTRGGLTGGQAGFRGGFVRDSWDYSLEYVRAYGEIGSDKVLYQDAVLHTIGAEIARVYAVPLLYGVNAKLGAGIGLTIPNLEGPENADNDVSFSLGGSLNYDISKNWTIGTSIKGRFFNTITRRTTYSSHEETLSNGIVAEVLDVTHTTESLNLNSVLIGISLGYNF